MELIHQFIRHIAAVNPLQVAFLENSIAGLQPEELENFRGYLDYCLGQGLTMEYLVASYDLIVKDTLAEQFYFRRHRQYRFSSFAEVAGSVYMNDDYMGKYMHGLAFTSFLWPNHTEMKRFFTRTIPRDQPGRYLEIGPGHGFYFTMAMKLTGYDRFEGIDISPTSVRLTRDILASGKFGSFSNYHVEEKDFLDSAMDGPHDAVVMGEVLEHVEQPEVFLERIRELVRPGGYVFITTCINSPAFDHIYLFRSVEHLEELILGSGLAIADKLILPYQGMTLEETNRRQLPVNVAYVLSKP